MADEQQTPFDRYPALGTRLAGLEGQRKSHLELGEKLLGAADGHIYVTDLVMLGVLKRSMDILDGTLTVTNRWNFTAAAPLLRLQLDSVLRLFYISQLRDAETFCREILAGKSLRDMRDDKNAKLTDARLREYARKTYPWIDDMYEETSKMVHLSEKHCFLAAQSINEREHTVAFLIGEGIPHWPEAELDNFLAALAFTTDALLKLILGWVLTKEHLYRCGVLKPAKS